MKDQKKKSNKVNHRIQTIYSLLNEVEDVMESDPEQKTTHADEFARMIQRIQTLMPESNEGEDHEQS